MTGPKEPSRVVVAMSGGVDSSVAALLLHKQGYQAIGVSMQVWDYRRSSAAWEALQTAKATCCAPADFNDARAAAAAIGIPYYVMDLEKSFEREVIDKFIEAYSRGQTPNPCIDCNTRVKFGELRKRAASFGAGLIATGHYARIEERQGVPRLLRGLDPLKDQSYFLYGLTPSELKQTRFPLGALKKQEVREIAAKNNLPTAAKAESQDICFVRGSMPEFLASRGIKLSPGDIIDRRGVKVGEHEGIHLYTVGQRQGLGIGGAGEPLYVLEIDAAANRIVAGPRHELERDSFMVGALNWCSPQAAENAKSFECIVQLRYRHTGLLAEVEFVADKLLKVHFKEEWSVVSPGQAAVFYDLSNEEVLGGGTIMRDDHAFWNNS